MDKPITLVRYFDELPETIFAATQDPATGVSFLRVMLPHQTIDCADPHQGAILEIFFMTMSGQKIVFTSCEDSKMRVYSFKPDMTLEKQAEQPTPNTTVNKIIQTSETFLICSLANGKFLGWNLATNQVDENPGHDCMITAMLKS